MSLTRSAVLRTPWGAPGPYLRPYAAKCVEGVFSELRTNGVLRSSATLGLAQEVSRIVGVSPVLHDLPFRYAEHVDGLDLHPLACGSDPLELSPVGATHDDTSRHPIPFGHHVLDGDAEVGEALSGLGEGLLEGVDQLGWRVVGSSSLSGASGSTISSARPKSPVETIS